MKTICNITHTHFLAKTQRRKDSAALSGIACGYFKIYTVELGKSGENVQETESIGQIQEKMPKKPGRIEQFERKYTRNRIESNNSVEKAQETEFLEQNRKKIQKKLSFQNKTHRICSGNRVATSNFQKITINKS